KPHRKTNSRRPGAGHPASFFSCAGNDGREMITAIAHRPSSIVRRPAALLLGLVQFGAGLVQVPLCFPSGLVYFLLRLVALLFFTGAGLGAGLLALPVQAGVVVLGLVFVALAL